MPLNKGCSKEDIQKNIVKLIEEGYPAKQAAAIAYHNAKKNGCDLTAEKKK